ncbi:MAG TPA: TRAP transporter small permease [Dehalococcoidales bacterium]|nr:TRAP transporter small permease [Dehalococcoidales bacterium]
MVAQPVNTEATRPRRTILGRIVRYLGYGIDPLSNWVGGSIAAAITFFMMAITFADVIGRGIFNTPVAGTLELTEYGMGVMVAFGIAYCAFRKGHIQVDIITLFVPRKVRHVMDMVAYLCSAAFFAVITWQTWLHVWGTHKDGLTSAVLLIPTWPFVLLVTIGAAILVLVFIRDLLDAIDKVGA